MKKTLIISIAIFIIVSIIFVLLLLIYIDRNNKSSSNNLSYSTSTISYSSESTISNSSTPNSNLTYKSSNNSFQFKYPNSWEITYQVQDDPRIGFAPSALADMWRKNNTNSTGIVFVRELDVSANDNLETTAKSYHGTGNVNKAISVNGYSAYQIVIDNDTLTDVSYTVQFKDKVVDFLFRQMDNTRGGKIDYSQYQSDFESIVNSIKFTI
jgi:hypothetical protein